MTDLNSTDIINKIIILDNKKCQVILSDIAIYKKLHNFLSFKTAGVEYTAAYQGGWSGITFLMNKSGVFSSGLLSKVKGFLTKHNVNFIEEDKRVPIVICPKIDLSNKLNQLNMIPRDYQNDIVNACLSNRKGIVRACTGSGKCSAIDSLHITEYGLLDYSELQDIVNTKLNPNDTIPLKMNLATPLTNSKTDKSSLLYYDGYGASRKITTQYGYTLTSTPAHKIKVINEFGDMVWKKVEELNIGDYSVISFGNQLFGKEEISLDDAYWYGLLIGDGSLTLKRQVKLTNMDEHILSFAEKYLNQKDLCNNNGKSFTIKKIKDSKALDICVNNVLYRNELKDFGFDYCKSIDKVIPVSIRKLSKKPLSMFLRGIYETDGWIEDDNNRPTICLALSNKKLIDQIHLILLNFGIIASRRVKKTTHEDSHIISIYKEFIPIFMQEIGLDPLGHKYKKINDAMEYCKNIKLINNVNNNIVPNQKNKIGVLIDNYIKLYSKKSLWNDCPIKKSTLRSWSIGGWRNPGKERLIKFVNWYKNKLINDNVITTNIELICNDIIYLCNSNYFYTPILKIEETYSDNYDFVVPETHSFVSQGFINHNTLCTAIITADINKPTIIYVIGLDLLKQFHDLFSSVFDEPIGFIGDGVCDIHRINIASIWTVSSALKVKKPILQEDEVSDKELAPNQIQSANILALLQKTKVHIFDESHVVTTDTIKSIFNKIDPEYIFGFSGTPFRDDGSDLLINGILGDQIINVPASQLITDGYLAQPIIKFVRVPKTYIGSGTSSYQTVYKEYVTENIIRNKIIIENTKELLNKNYQTLVLFKHLQHGKNLRELFDAENINYEYLSGNDALDKRLEVKERLLSKKSNLVLASSIFDIGVDIPSLSALVLAGGGKSSIRTLQRVGRVIRKNAGKKYSAIVDFYDDIRYLKSHTKIRYKIYKSEDGFRLIIPKNIMDLK